MQVRSLSIILAGLTCVFQVQAAAAPAKKACFSEINWESCTNFPNIQCASYKVPLDYFRPQLGSATIALTRVPATKQPRLGTLFINPGGPGGSGVSFAQGRANSSVAFTNGQYDLLGWDPRGINGSSPKFSCGFANNSEFNAFFANSFFTDGFEVRGNFTDPQVIKQFLATAPVADKLMRSLGEKCAQTNAEFLPFMGTASVVRDILAISDCIEGAGKPINFYGFSYGTVIGNYLVNMFPERVGRVIIDGVVDSIVWATEPSFRFFDRSLQDTQSVVAGFTKLCAAAGPEHCTFAKEGSTSESLLQEIAELIETAYDLHKAGLTNITSFHVRDFTYSHLPNPTSWASVLAPQLASWQTTFKSLALRPRLLDGDTRSSNQLARASPPSDPALQASEADIIVRCVDSIDQNSVSTTRVFEEIVNVTHTESSLFSVTMLGEFGGIFCHRFPIRAVERFTGPFNKKLANPMLVIGNTGDPRTPLENAQKITATLGNSARLLIQDGFGHTSLAETSFCTQAAVRDFLVNGTLPPVGQICSVNQGLFPPVVTA